MEGNIKFWDGNEWENYIQMLLKLYYGPGEYTEVPDKHRGDYGLEGFSRRDGFAFQCYAAEEPISVDELYKKQRDKITKDIKKFIDNKTILEGFLNGAKIVCWILVVPRNDSAKLLTHAQNKAVEVRKANLPYVDDGFNINVVDDSYFAVQKQLLASANLSSINIVSGNITHPEIRKWKESKKHVTLVNNLETKAGKLNLADSEQDFIIEMVRLYIEGSNTLELIRKDYPQIYEDIQKCKTSKENFLKIRGLMSQESGQNLLAEEIRDYKKRLGSEVNGLSNSSIEVLTYEAISDWIMRCPLDF